MTHLRIWKFRPAAGREVEFARAYGDTGAWPALFAKGEGYIGTTLLRPAKPGGWWMTIDRWERARPCWMSRRSKQPSSATPLAQKPGAAFTLIAVNSQLHGAWQRSHGAKRFA